MRISLGRRTLTFLSSGVVALALALPGVATANVFTDLDDPTTIESGPTISIASDKPDYAPGEQVTLTGSGWQPGESVAISVTGDGGEQPWQYDTVVVADDHGDIVDQFHIAEWWIPLYTVTATGEFSGVAMTSFTDTLSDFKQGTTAAAPSVGASCTPTLSLNNVLTSDDQRVKCVRTTSTPGETVVVSGFDFSEVPSGATNIQFAVEVEARTGPAGARAARVALSSDGTNFFPTTAAAGIDSPTFGSETADETKYSPGAPPTTCDDFGRSWSSTDLPNLRVRVGAGGTATNNTDAYIEIDRVRVRVCYDGSNLPNASLGAGRVAAVASPSETEIPWAVLVNKRGTIPAPWRATSYQIEGGSEVCINHADDNGVGSFPRVFDGASGLTAPAARGTYDITFRAYPNDPVAGVCNGTPLVLTLPDALTVGIFGDSFGRLNDANYDSKGWDDGDDGGSTCEIQRFDGLIDFDVVLRLRQNCIQNRSGISTAGLGNIHLKYRWGQETDVADPGSLKVEWRVSGGSWNTLATHTLGNNDGIATVTHSEDFALGNSASNTSIDIQFQGLTGAASQRALVDDVLVTGDSNATVSGLKFNDVDHNGVNAADPADPGAGGWVIKAYADGADGGAGVLSVAEGNAPAVASTTTAANGTYQLQLSPGSYVICEELQSGWRQSTPSNSKCANVPDPVANGGHAVTVAAGGSSPSNDFGNFELASVTGLKFDDVDHNGVNAADPADPGAVGWTIEAYADDGDGTLSATEAGVAAVASDVTDANGVYSFELPSGDYVICEQLMNDWRQSTPSNLKCDEVLGDADGGHAVDLDPGEDVTSGVDFGNFHLATVRGLKFNDVDHDGENALDPDDPPLESWKIRAYADDGNGSLTGAEATASPVVVTQTNASGMFTIKLPSGTYVICEELESGWRQSAPSNTNCDAVADPVAKGGHPVDLDPGEQVNGQDFGNFELATVSGIKFDDVDHNGTNAPDPADPGASGWTIKVFADDGDGSLDATEAGVTPVESQTTGAGGTYSFDLPSGKYVICEELQSGWRQSTPSNTKCDEVADPVAKGGHAIDLDPGEDVTSGVDFGNFHLATVTGLKFDDVDHNGVNAADPADPGAVGWTIEAYADDGDGTLSGAEAGVAAVASDVTDANGVYSFELPSGDYVICEQLQSDWRQSTPSNLKCDEVLDAADGGHAVDLDPGEAVSSGVDFGNFHLATVRGLKFNDVDHNGANADDPDDPPLDGWKIRAYADDGDGTLDATEAAASPAVVTQTNVTGDYTMKLPSGKYVICEELQSGWRQSVPSNTKCDLVADPIAKGGNAVDLDPGEQVNAQDFGNFELATVTGIKFNDVDHNGENADDPDDPPLENWMIRVFADDGDGTLDATEAAATPVESQMTSSNGSYFFELPSGKYVICEELQAGWRQSTPSNDACDEVDDPVAKGGHAVDLDPGEDISSGLDFGNFELATVSGIKFDDQDHNGANAGDPADPPLDGWTIEAYADDGDGALSDTEGDADPVASDVTDTNGAYSLDLPSGDYVICEQLQSGWTQSTPDPADKECTEVDGAATGGHAVDLDPGEDVTSGVDFGNFQPATVTGLKFNDVDHNGANADDPADPGASGWVIKAYADDGDGVLDATEAGVAAVDSDTTAGNGTYSLELPSGTYVICEALQAGWRQSAPSNSKCDELADPIAKGGHAVDLDPNEDVGDQDFGNFELATVSGIKFDDRDHNGANAADPSDPPLGTWVIKAYADDGDGTLDATEAGVAAVASSTTNGSGAYTLDLPSGKYVICEELQSGWTQSAPSNAKCDEVADPVAKGGHAVDLDPGEDVTSGVDFGNFQPATVTGLKFNDVDHNGTNADDPDDPGASGWVIKAYADDGDGVLDATEAAAAPAGQDTTDGTGAYSIDLPSGKYVVCEELQDGWAQSKPNNSYCDLVADPVAKGGYAIDLDPNEDITYKDFGNYQPGSVAGIKFDDRNKNGTKAASGEPVLGGWVIKAYADGGDGVLSATEAAAAAVDTDTTASDGTYKLDLPSGKYVVCEQLVTGWKQSAPSGTACANLADPAADGGHAVDVDPDEDITDKDFGNYRRATVTVRKTYSDGTTMTPVNVKLECTNGFAETKQSTPGSPGSPAVFTVDGFAAGDTCSVTEVSSPAGWTPDTSGCAITLTAGGAHSCTVVNVPETTIVTAGGCTFDRDTSRQGFQFPLIFTPDTGGYHKLNATNPGQFFLNVAYDGEEGDNIDIYVPFPFVLNGTNAIKVYEGVGVTNSSGKTCYAPTGSLLSQPAGQINWNYGTGGNNFGDTQKLTVQAPEDGLVYVRIHMAYGLKGVASGCVKGSTSPPQATCSQPRANFLIGDAPTVGYETYQFSFNGGPGNDSGGGKVESYNEFKKNPGIGGLVASTSTGLPFTNAKADIYQGNSKVGTVYTDADGWYMWTYKYTGKATTFTVKLPNNGNASQSATLKSNGYLNINFALP